MKFENLKKISRRYQSAIQVQTIEKESNVLQLSVLQEDQIKGVVFLNKLVENYEEN